MFLKILYYILQVIFATKKLAKIIILLVIWVILSIFSHLSRYALYKWFILYLSTSESSRPEKGAMLELLRKCSKRHRN